MKNDKVITLNERGADGLWRHGEVFVGNGEPFEYEAKVFDEPSRFGIGRGRISKLIVCRSDKMCIVYDREWIEKPKTKTAQLALAKLMEFYGVK